MPDTHAISTPRILPALRGSGTHNAGGGRLPLRSPRRWRGGGNNVGNEGEADAIARFPTPG
jgi:hypothetical protein